MKRCAAVVLVLVCTPVTYADPVVFDNNSRIFVWFAGNIHKRKRPRHGPRASWFLRNGRTRSAYRPTSV